MHTHIYMCNDERYVKSKTKKHVMYNIKEIVKKRGFYLIVERQASFDEYLKIVQKDKKKEKIKKEK